MERSLTVAILMGTMNGAAYIREQLESIAGQTERDWALYVSDDGSSDATCQIVERFAEVVPQFVNVRMGPRRGFVENFLGLARDSAIEADFFAFCDQDDVWHADKLSRALTWLRSIPESIPAVYLSRTELIGPSGEPMGQSTLFRRQPGFGNALVQSIGGANTMVFNRAARSLLKVTASRSAVSHDWCLYLLCTAVGGAVYYDPDPSIKYRQHGNNIMGSNRGVLSSLRRIKMLGAGTFSRWNEINRHLLAGIEEQMPSPNREMLRKFTEARSSRGLVSLLRLNQCGVYRQTAVGNLGLGVSALIGKL